MVPCIKVVVSVVQSLFEAVEVENASGGEVMIVVIDTLAPVNGSIPLVRGESGVATDLAMALVIPSVDGVAVIADEFRGVNVAAVLRAFREAG